jgi:hypothetical protein
LAAAGIPGPVVFAVVAVVQGLLRPGYSFVAHPVIALVAGPSGWVQDLNFVVLTALRHPLTGLCVRRDNISALYSL